MLSTDEIIDLYDRKEYKTIITNLKISDIDHFSTPGKILIYAINNIHIDLIIHTFTPTNVCASVISNIMNKPQLYPTLELILKNSPELCIIMRDTLWCVIETLDIDEFDSIQLLDIIHTYLFNANNIILMCNRSFMLNHLDMIDVLFKYGYDINDIFKKMRYNYANNQWLNFKFDTFIQLEKYGIDIKFFLDKIAIIFFNTDNIVELHNCLEYGANAIIILNNTRSYTKLNTIKYLSDYGVNFSEFKKIKNIIGYKDTNLDIIKFIMENGYCSCLNKAMTYAIGYDCPMTLKYFINSGADIHFDNESLLWLSINRGNMECVEILLENGANVHANDNSILLFSDAKTNKLIYENAFIIAKKLIAYGAYITNPTDIFYLYITKFNCPFDPELFMHLLDCGINFDEKPTSGDRYILEIVVDKWNIILLNMCLKYGANPRINNDNPLKIAIQNNNISMAKILLELGSIVDFDFDYKLDINMVNLLAMMGMISHQKKID